MQDMWQDYGKNIKLYDLPDFDGSFKPNKVLEWEDKKKRCSKCQGIGHNSTVCPNKITITWERYQELEEIDNLKMLDRSQVLYHLQEFNLMLGIENNVPSSHSGGEIQDITCVDLESAQDMSKVETLASTNSLSLSIDVHDELVQEESNIHNSCTMKEKVSTIITTVKTELEEPTRKKYSISFAQKVDLRIRVFEKWENLLKEKEDSSLTYIWKSSLENYNSYIDNIVEAHVREPIILRHATKECRIWMVAWLATPKLGTSFVFKKGRMIWIGIRSLLLALFYYYCRIFVRINYFSWIYFAYFWKIRISLD